MARGKPAKKTASELSAGERMRLVYDSGTEIQRQWSAIAKKVAESDLATYANGKSGDLVARCLRRGFVKATGIIVPDLRIITLPKGGEIWEAPESFTVDEGADLGMLIREASPESDPNNEVFKKEVLEKYPPCLGLIREVRPVLANFGEIENAEPAVIWGRSQGLLVASVRTVFTLARKYPELHKLLGRDWCWVNCLEEILFGSDFGGVRRVPGARWLGAERVAGLNWFLKWWGRRRWFAFIRESPLSL